MGHIAHLRKQFKSINTFDYIITLIKRRKENIIKITWINWLFIWRNINPYHPRMLVTRLVEIGPVVLEKKMKMWKVREGRTDRRTDRQTDDERQVIRKAHLSFQLRWAKNKGIFSKRNLKPTTFFHWKIPETTDKHTVYVKKVIFHNRVTKYRF